MKSRAPLHGIRVLDLSRYHAGAICAGMLADAGAEVIRLGPTDPPPAARGALDRNKFSALFNLSEAADRSALSGLISSAAAAVTDDNDILMSLGLTTERLMEINEALVCADLGSDNRQGADARDRGQRACFGLMAALRHAEAVGRGQLIQLPDETDETGSAPTCVLFSQVQTPVAHGPHPPGAHTEKYLSEAPPIPLTESDKRALRDGFGTFATGVTVITTRQKDGTPRGFTANSFTSVSLDPPLLLVCLAKSAHSFDSFIQGTHFAVNILTEDQKHVSGVFASRAPDKFDQVAWAPGVADMPVLEGALANFTCAVEKSTDAGDHVILIGRVIAHQKGTGTPLGYYAGQYFTAGLEEELVSAASRSGAVDLGAVLTRGNQVLLSIDEKGGVSVPKLRTGERSLPALKAHLEKLGLRARLDLLFAVFSDTGTGRYGIYYKGTAEGYVPRGHRFLAPEAIPFDKFLSSAESSMVRRFCEEFSHGSFGIYHGDETAGVVQRVANELSGET